MAQLSKEIELMEEVTSLPSTMQHIYLQLIAAIDSSFDRLSGFGAEPAHISEEFIESTVTKLLNKEFTQQSLQERVDQEFERKILESAELATLC